MNSSFGFKADQKEDISMPKVRVSTGTAIALGLLRGKMVAFPTTAYLMTYRDNKCTANCGFCTQARKSTARADLLSRVSWPAFETAEVLNSLEKISDKGRIKRVCIQALNYAGVFAHLSCLIRLIKQKTGIPISVSCQPLNEVNIRKLIDAGIERIGIPLDAASEDIFDRIKGKSAGGPYRWDNQFRLLAEAVSILGKNRVSTHLIVGLGESEQEMVETIQRCVDLGVLPALFAFTPIPGTNLEKETRPALSVYRRMQMARWIIVNRVAKFEEMKFDGYSSLVDFGVSSQTLACLLNEGDAFRTSGCPQCNRPFYNERPGGPLYNYPQKLSQEDILIVKKQLGLQ